MDKGLDIARLRLCLAAHAVLHARPQALAALLRHHDRRPREDLDWGAADRTIEWLDTTGAAVICLGEERYPAQLAAIPDPPPLLFVRGAVSALSTPQVAIVGSRRASAEGQATAFRLARELAAQGLVVTSGLARGIDAAAHGGALAAEGITIAVFGCGLGRVYPWAHRRLAAQICEGGGAVVSELPPGLPPQPFQFPRRNRIISGLSLGTVVVQAAPTSGSLGTAQHALDQGREVYAVPGSINDPLARGCHLLLRQGATLLESASDIVRDLLPATRALLRPARGLAAGPVAAPLSPQEAAVTGACGFAPTAFDTLAERTGLTAQQLSSILMALEIKGRIRALLGGDYVRTGESGALPTSPHIEPDSPSHPSPVAP